MSKRGRKTNQVWWCKVLSINRPGKPVKSEARRVRIDRYRLPQVCCSAGLQHSFLQNGIQGDLHIFMRHDGCLCARRGAKSMFVGLRWTPRGTCRARQQVYFRGASMDSYTLVHANVGTSLQCFPMTVFQPRIVHRQLGPKQICPYPQPYEIMYLLLV